ncbi:FAD-dependent oxidoreductase [Gordonia sp. NPDC003424]
MSAAGGHIAVIGAGPGGLATALAMAQAGHRVSLYEKASQVRSSGNILNLWPPPVKALGYLGVDTEDLGYPCTSSARRADGHLRMVIPLPQDIKDEYEGGFIGLLRPELFARMTAALPESVTVHTDHELTALHDHGDGVTLTFGNGARSEADLVVGADGIHSTVRRQLWGDAPLRMHRLHCFGGFTFEPIPGAKHGTCVMTFSKDKQGSWSSIKSYGKVGFQWWITSPWDPGTAFTGDMWETALAQASSEFHWPLPQMVEATDPADVTRWEIRDRPPLPQWSRGRVTLIGDAAHPTSPYAAYGAGMSIEDGYFLGREISRVDLDDTAALARALAAFEEPRRAHTSKMSGAAYSQGKLFHHAPPGVRHLRDFVFDHTPVLQKAIADRIPADIYKMLDEIDGPIEPATA